MFRLLFVAILRPMTHVKFKEASVVRHTFWAKLLALCVMIMGGKRVPRNICKFLPNTTESPHTKMV